MQPTMLSPAPTMSVSGSSVVHSELPSPRRTPLRSGSKKETALINYLDHGIAQINRRFAYKDTSTSHESQIDDGVVGSSAIKGYRGFKDASRDIERLLDVVWVSGTPSLQIPHLLSLALLALTCLPAFPAAPKTMFSLFHKLDFAFASLIQGRNIDTGEPLPGFESGKSVSATEKVRIKSLSERTRVAVVQTMANGEFDLEADIEGSDINPLSDMDEDVLTMEMGEEDDFDMEIARVYVRTIVELGDSVGGPAIGIPIESDSH